MVRSLGFMSLALVLALVSHAARAEDPAKKTALDLLPPSTIAYIEVPAPGKLIETALDHPLAKQLEQQPDYQKALDTPDMRQLLEVVKLFEDRIGTKWRPALTTLTAEGAYVGVEMGTQGVIVLVKSRDAALLEKTRDAFIELARQDAANNGRPDPIKMEEYHGVQAYKFDDVYYATIGPWIVFTNKAKLGQMVVDNALEAGRPCLGKETQFMKAAALRQGSPTVWAYVDLTILRVTGLAQTLADRKSDNPAADILIGGILAAAPDAPFVTASLSIEADRIAFSTAIPYDAKKAAKKREYYFGPDGQATAPPLLAPRDTLFSLTTYRDFSLMWKQAPDLFDDNVNAKFAEAEGTLTTLFAGRSFPDDILANLEPGMQLVVARQRFGKDDIAPEIKLPAVAAVFTMKKPEETARQFRITFLSLVGFLNIAGGQNGIEALEPITEKEGNIHLAYGQYLPPKNAEQKTAAGIHFNASPTVAFVGNKFIISSAKPLAIELAQSLEKDAPAAEPGVNTKMLVSGDVLRQVLADNRPQLVAQNQEEKGHSQADAEKEIDLLMQLLAGLKESTLSLTTKDNALGVNWELKLTK